MQRRILRHGQLLVIDLREWKLTLEKLYLVDYEKLFNKLNINGKP